MGSKRVLQGGEKSSPLVVLCDLWLVYRVYGLGGEKWKCGPGREIMVLGQMLVAGSVVRGEKLRVWAKHWWREVWSRERNRAPGSSPSPPECGPRREIMVLGQALMAGSVVQGAKPCPWVKPRLARVWSEERNYGLWSNAGGGKYGPGRETAGLGQAPPRPSVVRGEKLWSLVKRWWREVWFREQNRAPGSSPSECGPRREIMVLGQALVAGSMVQGAKLRPRVKPRRSMVQGAKPCPRVTPSPGMVQGEKLRPRVKPVPARVWSREQNRAPGSPPAPPECGPGSQTAALGQARPCQSMVQGAKLRPWVTPCPAEVWFREPNCGPGQARPRQSMVQGAKPRPRVNSSPAEAWSGEQNRAPGSPLPRPSMVLASEIQKGVKNKHMKDGFIKVAVTAPDSKVADCAYNIEKMIEKAEELAGKGVHIAVFPELGISAYTCSDLFLQEPLLTGAEKALEKFVKETKELDLLSVVSLPLRHQARLYNVAAVVKGGKVLGLVPKSHIPMYSEFYEGRHFASGDVAQAQGKYAEEKMGTHRLTFQKEEIVFGIRQLFCCEQMPELCLAVEICEDLWMPVPPSSYHAMAGATIIANASASDELTGKAAYRRDLVKNQSARTVSAYLYADAAMGESTTDLVYGGHHLIAENGTLLAENKAFAGEDAITEIDCKKLAAERRRMGTFPLYPVPENEGYVRHFFAFETMEETKLTRKFEKTPFVPVDRGDREERCNEILNIQAAGLAKRLRHTGCKSAVIGLSGGLDSTLALLVTIRAFDQLNLDRKGIVSVTMPCFGTTNRTYDNAVKLAQELGTTLKEISIEKAVLQHFKDIGHDPEVQDVTYENGQARERTQILMNIANQAGGLVIGTGDMSELALGWATYNGDHMSMYGVNCSVPKTLVRFLVQYFADNSGEGTLKDVLYDILDTPVSPELLPPKEGEIAQKTEDIVGPYELHDFFLYHMLRFGYMPSKIYRIAKITFEGEYEAQTIYRWLSTFVHRFFRQQFKRSCLPDGPKVGSVAVSPRGDLRMPSDASDALWKEDLAAIRKKEGWD